jgi:ABC-type phosphate transport system substrate-binding protein
MGSTAYSQKLAVALLITLACLLPAVGRAELVVILNAQSSVEQLSKTQVVNIFLGHSRELPNGVPASPVDLPFGMPEKAAFYQALVNKDLDQIAAYWSRLVFAGSTSPPVQAGSTQEVLQYVASHRGGIAYLERRLVDARVKVVLSLP